MSTHGRHARCILGEHGTLADAFNAIEVAEKASP